MGYSARFSGEITITPPLTWGEMRAKVETPQADGLQDLRLRLHEEVTDTPEGQLKVITGQAVRPDYAQGKGYDMQAELQSLVDAYGSSHQFAGYIEATGDEGDRWRLCVRNGKVVQVYPQVTWPDDEAS